MTVPTFHAVQNGATFSKMNTAGQQNFSERLFLEAIFTNGTNALAGKELMQLHKIRNLIPKETFLYHFQIKKSPTPLL